MRIISEKTLKEFVMQHPQAARSIKDWIRTVRRSEWKCFADIKASFNSVDSVGNHRYVFNIKGNDFRIVVVIQFTPPKGAGAFRGDPCRV